MPKMKTHKGSAKRFSFSGSGKVLRTVGWANKKMLVRSYRARHELGGMKVVAPGDAKRVRRLLPYGVE